MNKALIHYQIKNSKREGLKELNVSLMRRMHNFFYEKNILYSDIINTEVILFPLLKKEEEYFIYTKNYFYENWNEEKFDNLIQYTLPAENIENIQKNKINKDNIYKIKVSDFFKEYEIDNIVFANIEINENIAEVFLNTRIEGKKINKNLAINKKFESERIL